MRAASLFITIALALGTGFGAAAQEARPQSQEEVCRTRADELNITPDLRETYMRECLAGERLNRGDAPAR